MLINIYRNISLIINILLIYLYKYNNILIIKLKNINIY